MDYMPLDELKSMMDLMSIEMYKGEIKRSEIIRVGETELFVTDISGYWNGQGDKIGMLRYYFNNESSSYNLLMKYPLSDIKITQEVKNKMIESIVLR